MPNGKEAPKHSLEQIRIDWNKYKMCIRDSDMDVPAADVLVYIYDVGLVAISHRLHILLGEVGKLAVCQPVIQ